MFLQLSLEVGILFLCTSDGPHWTVWFATVAMKIPKSHFLILNQLGVLSPAQLTLNIFSNVFFEQVLHVTWSEDCFYDKTTFADWSWCSTQIFQEKVHYMFWMSIQLFAQRNKVQNDCFLWTHLLHFWWFQHDLSILCQVRIILCECINDSGQQILIPLGVSFCNFSFFLFLLFSFLFLLFLFIFVLLLGEVNDLNLFKLVTHKYKNIELLLLFNIFNSKYSDNLYTENTWMNY